MNKSSPNKKPLKLHSELIKWTQALVIFGIITIIVSMVLISLHTYLLQHLDSFTSFELDPFPLFFSGFARNFTVPFDLNKESMNLFVRSLIVYDFVQILESVVVLIICYPQVQFLKARLHALYQ